MQKTLTEIACLMVAALILGVGYNQVVGNITLDRKQIHDVDTKAGAEPPTVTTTQPTDSPVDFGELKVWTEDGIQFCNLAQAVDYYDAEEIAFFVDARNLKEFVEGHITTAFYLDTYKADRLIDDLREELNERPYIVVYCSGGDCEDSIYLATALVEEFDYVSEQVYVFKGGMEEWTNAKLPTDEGEERGEWRPRDE